MLEELTLRKASEIMGDSAPILDKDLALSAAIEKTEKYKTDRAILTEDKRIRGILTYREVIFKLGTVRTKQATPTGMHASSFMSEPVEYVRLDEPFMQALRKMEENSFTSVPVVDEGEIPKGIISRWELAEQLVENPKAVDTIVRNIMRTFPVSVNLYTRILHVRQLLFQHNLSVVPVMDDGEFVGVVGVDEILNIFLKYYELSRGEPKRLTPLKFVTVSSAIRLRPPKIDPDASIAEAADLMLRYRYRAVIVVDNGKPVGHITGLELAKFILHGA
ncbi:MAG: CBS domain-containing protein [Desulfurococcales archaeon]|nr:CBS domain-containing protein [Desulfurococcales archaeon]